MTLTHVSLFTGIGGIDLAAEWAGFHTIAMCEIDPYCRKVLAKHWPSVPVIEDVKDVTAQAIMAYADQGRYASCLRATDEQGNRCETVSDTESSGRSADGRALLTLLSGGFPCQPHSVAGKRQGASDERDLWPQFRRVIGDVRPVWVLAENVPGLFTSTGAVSGEPGDFFRDILRDFAALGYVVGWCTYGAVDVGAWHRRDRVFIIGYAKHNGFTTSEVTRSLNERCYSIPYWQEQTGWQQESDVHGRQGLSMCGGGDGSIWSVEPNVGRVANGVPGRVDRLKALGNAVVPQQIYPVLKAIADIETTQEVTLD